MCQDYEGRVGELEYKTLRYPGHGAVFAALRELGSAKSTTMPFPRRSVITVSRTSESVGDGVSASARSSSA